MSTRGMFTFRSADGSEEYHVYRHSDNYPTGAAEALVAALEFAWQLPRYEADEFAAAFVAANKSYYINQELALLRELEKIGKASSPFERIAEIRKELETCRRYAKDFNGGGVRLMPSGKFEDVAPQDLEYRYIIQPRQASGDRKHHGGATQMDARLLVHAFAVRHQGDVEYVETGKPDRNGYRTWKQRKVPKARQGWKETKLFTAPLKSGGTLKAKAKAWEEADRKAA
jgi:hypothetical protein